MAHLRVCLAARGRTCRRTRRDCARGEPRIPLPAHVADERCSCDDLVARRGRPRARAHVLAHRRLRPCDVRGNSDAAEPAWACGAGLALVALRQATWPQAAARCATCGLMMLPGAVAVGAINQH